MVPTEETRIHPAALPTQVQAYKDFLRLTTEYPGLALQTFDEYTSAAKPEIVAGAIIAMYFETRADEHTIFSASVEESAEPEHVAWRRINQASRSTVEQDAAARLKWRQARVKAYLFDAYVNAPPATFN